MNTAVLNALMEGTHLGFIDRSIYQSIFYFEQFTLAMENEHPVEEYGDDIEAIRAVGRNLDFDDIDTIIDSLVKAEYAFSNLVDKERRDGSYTEAHSTPLSDLEWKLLGHCLASGVISSMLYTFKYLRDNIDA